MHTFNQKIASLSDHITRYAWACSNELISIKLCRKLKIEIDSLYSNRFLIKAKIGTLHKKETNYTVRGDYIYWFENPLQSPEQEKITEEISAIGNAIKRNLYMNFNSLESHYALYPPGSHYAKHLDNSQGKNTRYLTFVLFLNDKWKPGHGGELSIYREDETHLIELHIEPKIGKLVLFLSNNIYHEVLLTNQPRYSLTGWFSQTSVMD